MTIQEIAYMVRQHYYEGFIDEYSLHKRNILNKFDGDISDNQFSIVSDYNAKNNLRKNAILQEIIKSPGHRNKLYREDFVVLKNQSPIEDFVFYPVLTNDEDDFVEEDIPAFTTFKGKINKTDIEIQPFPWFQCRIEFFPAAEAIKGILDCWFFRWFFRYTKPDPFLNVIHRLDGPQIEEYGGESYFIDFGTAPPEAFLDLVYETSRGTVAKIIIN
jgi:hypothetical protein